MVVHGSDGLDEVTTTGATTAIRLHEGRLENMTLHPSDIGLNTAKTADLIGGTPEENAAAMRDILNGAKNPYRDIVIFNAAVAMFGAGHAHDLSSAATMAASSLDQGLALDKLDQLVAITNRGE
jgi:anthranilate phosphoribosyltransferase